MCSDLHAPHVSGAGGAQRRSKSLGRRVAGPRRKESKPHPVCGGAYDLGADGVQSRSKLGTPLVQRYRIENDVSRRAIGERLSDDENRHSGRMIDAFDERQPSDHLGRPRRREPCPPGAGAGSAVQREHAKVPA
jgi:hypothetical protein